MDKVRIPCGLGSSVSGECTTCAFSRLSEGGGTRLHQNSVCTYSFDVGAERNNCNACGIDNEVMKLRGWDLVWNNSFGSMISHSTF